MRHNSTVETTRVLSLFTIYVSIRNKILHLRDVCSSFCFAFLSCRSRLWILAMAWCLYKNYSLISVCSVCIYNRNAAQSHHLTRNCSMSFGCDITSIQKSHPLRVGKMFNTKFTFSSFVKSTNWINSYASFLSAQTRFMNMSNDQSELSE